VRNALNIWSREHKLPLRDRDSTCEHLEAISTPAAGRSDACEECNSTHSLRACLTCGHVGCCDSQYGHARVHASETGHQVMRTWQSGAFVYCYEHGYL